MRKLNIFIASFAFLMICSNLISAQTIRYVKPKLNSGSDGNDGSSWMTAYATIQKAIEASSEGDQIWVASGTYYPTAMLSKGGMSRNQSLQLKKGVSIYGSLAIGAKSLAGRDFETAEKQSVITADNEEFHIIVGAGDLGNLTIDGFKITAGNADGPSNVFYNERNIFRDCGGALFLSNVGGNVTLRNLIIDNNKAQIKGGGLFVDGENSGLVLENVKFSNNSTKAEAGAAIYMGGIASVKLSDITFDNNVSGGNATTIYIKSKNVNINGTARKLRSFNLKPEDLASSNTK